MADPAMERLSAKDVRDALLAEAHRVAFEEPAEEPAAPRAKPKNPVEVAAREVLQQERPVPEASSEELEASAARGKANLDKAMRLVTRGPDRVRMDREAVESYYQTKFGPEEKSEDSTPVPAGKNFAQLVKGLSDEERDALMTAVYEADSADDEYVQALRRDEEEAEEEGEVEWVPTSEAYDLPAWATGAEEDAEEFEPEDDYQEGDE